MSTFLANPTEPAGEEHVAAAFFAQAFAQLPLPATVVDFVTGRVVATNEAHASLVGLTAPEMVGLTPPYPWWAEGWRPRPLERSAHMSFPYEGMFRHSTGLLIPVEIRTFVVESDQVRAVVVVTSTSERRQLERQLAQSGKLAAIGELAAGVAHEINNPLFAILGLTEFLLREAQPGTKAHERLELIHSTGNEMKEIVSALLDFAREPTDEHVPFLVTQTVRDAVALLRRTNGAKNVELVERYEDEDVLVVGSSNQVKQIVVNLVRNAQQAMPDGGVVRIEVEPDPEGVAVSVSDTGPGIPPDVLPRIFEPFFTTKRQNGGTGLGLAVSHGLAAMHGGDIVVESMPGQGTTFRLVLPVEQSA
ncbi:MAG: hypothetical protein JO073_05580 [Actinobacteria bacterium]|nr:hypothetical protein [Actinomycetota bacterium]